MQHNHNHNHNNQNHNHGHNHDHHGHHGHQHHSGHQNEPKNCGSDMCLVENREVENFSGIDQAITVNHVWESCRPGGTFTSSAPTVSAGKVRLTRVYLQSMPKCSYDTDDQPACPTGQPPAECPRQNRSLLETVKNLAASLMYPGAQQRNEGAAAGPMEENEDNENENEMEGVTF